MEEKLWKTNKLICGDNLDELAKIPKESIDLIYIDPPFFTHKQYEVIWGDEAEVRSFKDRWEGGIEHYISWLKPRVQAMYEVLKPTGSFYIHCDWHANAHIRIMCDEIFGSENFRNEIIWKRTNNPKGSQFKDKKFGIYIDTIFFYTKSEKYIFELDNVREQLTEEEIIKKYPKIDGRGRYLEYPILRSASKGKRPNLVYTYKDFTPGVWGWVIKKERLEEIDKRGDLGWRKNGTPFRKYRPWEDRGKPLGNLWDDIEKIQPNSKEAAGYPTQKPEALLERIIKASSNKSDVVLDAFCGCGTTVAVAQKLGRRWIGIDISPTAIKIMERRLEGTLGIKEGVDYEVIGLPTTVEDVRKLEPFEFQNWVVIDKMRASLTRKKTGDMGLDGYYPRSILTEEAGIQVKQSDGVGRNVVDNFETALKRAGYKKGYIVAFSFSSGAYEEVARLKNKGEIEIKLVTVEKLLNKQKI